MIFYIAPFAVSVKSQRNMQRIISQVLHDRKSQSLNREFVENIKNPLNPATIFVKGREVLNFCSNDYLRLSMHKDVISVMVDATLQYGVGSGGTRNISGTNAPHTNLEKTIADLHGMQSALLFSSAYIANAGALYAIGRYLPNVVLFSDEQNHASIIHGIRYSGARKMIYKHADLDNLELLLSQHCNGKINPVIVCESVYSMSGSLTDLPRLERIAKKYNAMTYIDEVHSVGIYGEGRGLVAQYGVNADIINGTLGKAFGTFGGYIAGNADVVEFIKSFATTFIFSTSLPPALCAASKKAIEIALADAPLREKFWQNVLYTKNALKDAGLKIFDTDSHIISVMIGGESEVKSVAKQMLESHQIYIQPIFYPTVPIGQSILRITVSPFHTLHDIRKLADGLRVITS